MSWHDIDPQELAMLSYPDKKRLKIRRTLGQPQIIVAQRAPRGDQVIYLRVDKALHDRINRLVAGSGNVSTAIIAIVQEALDQLEEGNATWTVVSGQPDVPNRTGGKG